LSKNGMSTPPSALGFGLDDAQPQSPSVLILPPPRAQRPIFRRFDARFLEHELRAHLERVALPRARAAAQMIVG
jgi:hypothetical protein